MTDQRATDDAVEPSNDVADDDITIDPELTTAADADWLADLRAEARASGVSVSELLRSADPDATRADRADPDPDPDPDEVSGDAHQANYDSATVAPDDDTMDAVRAAVAAVRPAPEMVETSGGVDQLDQLDQLDDEGSEQPHEAAPTDAPAPVVAASRPAPPPVSAPAPQPTIDDQSDGPRWQPPARLAIGRETPVPTLGISETRRSYLPLVAGLVTLIIALAAIVAVLVWPTDDETPVDPPDTGVELEVDREAPIGEDSE